MVLFKRKPVQFLPALESENEDEEVWHIPQTGELFTSYEDYLSRMEFYKQKRFICTITGHSGLDFFEALSSERTGAAVVDQAFPEALKAPVLRRVQFQTVSRIDTLVDHVYDEFKSDYYPGEAVMVSIEPGERLQGVVRDKTHFGSKVLPDGTMAPPYSRYFVSLDGRPEDEAVVDDQHIFRDRKIFTKAVLRSFIKKTVSREAWNGAPWLVKHDVAEQYQIETRIPSQLRYDNKLLERKQLQARKRLSATLSEITVSNEASPISAATTSPKASSRLPDLKPKSHKSKAQQALQAERQQAKGDRNGTSRKSKNSFTGAKSPGEFTHLPIPGNPFQFSLSYRGQAFPSPLPPVPSLNGPALLLQQQQQSPPSPLSPPTPPPPPVKYPIEDLQIEPRDPKRPRLGFFCCDPPENGLSDSDVDTTDKGESVPQVDRKFAPYGDKIEMKTVGPLLETWDTLNVYCEIFKLDSFTWDDFVEAMVVASEEQPVQLFDEIHCAVLKVLVSSEEDGGKVQIQLPELDDQADEEENEGDEEQEDADESQAPSPEPVPARATRGSLAKAEAERMAAEMAAAEQEKIDAENAPKHRAEQVLAGYNWTEHLSKRDFEDGGWQRIMVGLLHQLSKGGREKQMARCEELLQRLVPVAGAKKLQGRQNGSGRDTEESEPDDEADEEPSQQSVRRRYAELDLDHRVQALQIICMLTAETKTMRAYMEECSEQMTAYRKEKIEWQRKRKHALEDIKALYDQRKAQLPENTPAALPAKTAPAPATNGYAKVADADESLADVSGDLAGSDNDTEANDRPRKKLKRSHLPSFKKKKAAATTATTTATTTTKEQADKEATPVTAKPFKQSKQFIKLLKDIQKKEEEIAEYEREVAVIDNDLREADCARTRVLGKDRFWNRYYWFERNGMPYAGLPTSSTAAAGYANGCLWVQGPDDLEREGYIDLPADDQDEYRAKFNTTVPERKKREENGTSVFTAGQWGFYTEPSDLDALIDWLDPRGFNELKLRKELINFREKIVKHMDCRKECLAPGSTTKKDEPSEEELAAAAEAARKEEEEEAAAKAPNGRHSKRLTTRGRTSVAPTPTIPDPPPLRCLLWENTMAIEEEGHLHCEAPPPPPPPPPPPKGRGRKSGGAAAPAPTKKDGADHAASTTKTAASKAAANGKALANGHGNAVNGHGAANAGAKTNGTAKGGAGKKRKSTEPSMASEAAVDLSDPPAGNTRKKGRR